MSIPRHNSLVTCATLWILVVVLLVGAVSLWWGNTLAIERETTRTQNQLQELLDTVERPASIACFLQNQQLANEVSQGLLSNQIVKRIVIRAGATLLAEAVRPTDAGGVQQVSTGNPADVIHRPLLSPFNPDETVGEILLAPDPVALANRVAQASSFIAILLMVQIVAVGVTVVLAMYGLITRPLRQISDRLRDLPAEQGVKLTHSAGHENDEIGRVVNYINHLLNRLVGLLNAERHLRLQHEIEERKFRSIFENAGTGIFLIDHAGLMLSYNPACQHIMQATGRSMTDPMTGIAIFFDHDEARARNLIEACEQENCNTQQNLHLKGQGGKPDRWIHLTLSRIEDVVFQGVVNDITERKSVEAAAQKVAVTDAMTGIFNRLGFETKLRDRLNRSDESLKVQSALLLIDLDFFKQVNDTYGHDAGDQVLIQFARLLESVVRKSDLIGRLGGDEFVLFLDHLDQSPALEKIARNIIAGVAKPIEIGGGQTARIGASIGITTLISDQSERASMELLFKQADEAMYQAKKNGRNTYCFYSQITGARS